MILLVNVSLQPCCLQTGFIAVEPSRARMTSLSKPRVVVGLDFGTTYSGFAFAHISDPEKVYAFYEYPRSGGGGDRNYCKTLTGSYYKQQGVGGAWQFKSWGYPARTECGKDVQAYRKAQLKGGSLQPFEGSYITRFKLHLATPDMGSSSAKELPPGLTVNVLITDYLREMGAFILRTLQSHYDPNMTTNAIQWCVTVPSIWNNAAKAVMRKCVFDAGLVDRTSPHPLIMVLEPEAASFACHKNLVEQKIRVGDKMLVADIGGGTADIVVQEVQYSTILSRPNFVCLRVILPSKDTMFTRSIRTMPQHGR